ncbi:collagen triple helix repeat-containing protein, partial [Myroides odoratus DSM 2801]
MVIDVTTEVTNNFEEIINRTEVQEILNQYITENGGNIHYDGGSFTYLDENGNTVTMDMTTIIQGSETVTTLVKDPLNNGKYIYTNEAGVEVVIDVTTEVTNNFEEIINRTEVQEVLNQYITENGGNIHYDGGSFTYLDENGNTVTMDMTTIIQSNETVTTLVKDPLNNGKYIYTNEAGVEVVIDVTTEVTNNFEEIINRTEVQEVLNQYITENGGNIHYDGGSFTYLDENGNTVTMDMTTIIQGSETVTTLVKDPLNNGKY